MPKIAIIAFMLLAATAAEGGPLILGKDGNLIANGDFADGLSNWTSSATSPAVGSASVVNGELSYNVITDSGTNTHLQFTQRDFLLQNGRTYRLTFSARATANRTLRANVRSVSLGGYVNFDVALTSNMTTFTTTFTSTKATINDTRLSFYMGGAGDTDVWLDNVSLADVSLAGAITTGPSWFSAGETVAVQPPTNGMVYLAKVRQAYTEYTNAGGAFDEASYAAHAAISTNVTAANIYHLNTASLINGAFNQVSGSYEVLLVSNGVVQAVQPFHLAFTDRPISPHYEVSVRTNGSSVFTNLTAYFSYRVSEYIRDFGGDGKSVDVINNVDMPVNAHSWAGISTADYPITVRVRVLPAAQNPYYDGTNGISLPLGSARVLPSSYGIPCTVENGDTIVFTLNRPEKVMVIPNYEAAMAVFNSRAVGNVPLTSFETTYTASTIPSNFKGNRADLLVSEGYKNPLVFMGRQPDTFAADLGFAKNDASTLVVHPKDRPTQEQLSAARVVWFEPGVHDLSRMGVSPSYRTYINAGQIFYLEEGAFVAAGFKKDETAGAGDCYLVGRGVVSGINHIWGGGGYDMNSQAVSVDIIDGLNFVDRANWGIDGGDVIRDIGLLGAWHGNCDGLDSLDHCTVRNSLLMAHDDNLKLNDHTYAEHLVIYMLGTNAHPIMFKEMLDDVVFSNSVVKDADILGYWKQSAPSQTGWDRITPGAIACLQTRNVTIENALFSNIRIESPYLSRVFSFYNLYSEGVDWPYVPDWLDIDNRTSHSSINGLTLENITVNSPLLLWRSLLGSGFANSFANVSVANLMVNGVTVTDSNRTTYCQISGYVNGTDPVDGGTGRLVITDPVQNVTFTSNPTSGTMTLVPESPADAGAPLTISFADWMDVSTPLSYSVLVDDVVVSAKDAAVSRVITAPTVAGPHMLKGRIYDSLNNVSEVSLGFTVNTPQETWRRNNFGSAANSGNGADMFDYDGDGLANLVEFAFGLDPTSAASLQLPLPQRVNGNSVITFNQPTNVSGITYHCEWSPDLAPGSWKEVPDSGHGSTHIFITPIGDNTRLFMRYRITSP